MPLFKDTVALEACPAKTAESVSYGATFAVLVWILATNYTGLGFANEQNVAAADSSGLSARTGLNAEAANSQAAIAGNTTLNLAGPANSQATRTQPEISQGFTELISTPQPEFVAWPASLELEQQTQNHSRLKLLSTLQSTGQLREQTQPPQSTIDDLALPLPYIDSDNLPDSGYRSELASNETDGSGLVHAITVTGSEAERPTARPENISRPQIPRAFRAQDIQRSLVLPPRIQALKP